MDFKEKIFFTLFALLAFLSMSNFPYYSGLARSDNNGSDNNSNTTAPSFPSSVTATFDPFYHQRYVMGASHGSLMEFGVSAILLSSFVLHLLLAGKVSLVCQLYVCLSVLFVCFYY